MRRFATWVFAALLAPVGPSAWAESTAGAESDRVEALERRVEELEQAERDTGNGFSRWTDHVSIGGSANVGYYEGEGAHPWNGKDFQVWDARFFIDAETGGPVELFGHTLVRNAGVSFEWNLVRLGQTQTPDIGDLYIELQHLGRSRWISVQVGRFQIPIGEAYLRYGKGYAHKPFVSNPVSGAWFWDEGLKVYGGDDSGLFAYVASITENETLFDTSLSGQKQYTIKLTTTPVDGLQLSASGLYAGAVQTVPGSFASGEGLWLGEMWLRRFGNGAMGPNFVFGAPVGPGPARLGASWLVGGDVVVDALDGVELWLSYSYYASDQGSPTYSRTFHAWIAELVLRGERIDAALRPFYLGVRANGLGPYEDARGYLLDSRSGAVGYNMSSLTDYSAVLGWKMRDFLTLRIEYTRRVIDLVDGTPISVRTLVDGMNAGAVELGIAF